jgi:hypothetical protein
MCDDILHVNMVHYLKTPYIINYVYVFFANFISNEYIRPLYFFFFYRTLFLRFSPMTSPQ